MEKIHCWECEEERCVLKPQWRPRWQNNPPRQDRPLCGLFTLRAIPDSRCTRRRARQAAHLQRMCTSQWKRRLEKLVMGAKWVYCFLSVCLSGSFCCMQINTHKETHLNHFSLFSWPSMCSWLGRVMRSQWERATDFCTSWMGFCRMWGIKGRMIDHQQAA